MGYILNDEDISKKLLAKAVYELQLEKKNKQEFKNISLPNSDYSFTSKGILVLRLR